jgi:hypothetical protein
MENLSIILIIIGVSVLIFSVWGHILLRKHLKSFKNSFRHVSTLTDERYFELKSKQEYIIAASTIIFAVLSFIGFSSIKEIKSEINSQMATEKSRIDSLNNSANITKGSYSDLEIRGKDLADSVRNAMRFVAALKGRIGKISEKDVIRQNIFIVDPLRLGDFPHSKEKNLEDFRVVNFKNLRSISGQVLPSFNIPPSIVCFSSNGAIISIRDVTTEGFKINPFSYSVFVTEDSKVSNTDSDVRFSVWISQKNNAKSFSDEFSDEFGN